MKLKITVYTLFLLSTTLILTACRKEKAPFTPVSSDCPNTISFQTQIKTLMDNNCSTSGCHDATGQAGYVLTNHSQVSLHANQILKVIRHEAGVENMPQGAPKLADSLIQQFSCWINQGKPNN